MPMGLSKVPIKGLVIVRKPKGSIVRLVMSFSQKNFDVIKEFVD